MSSELTIGEYLKQMREEQGFTLQDVSDAINVRKGQLRAIEEGKIDELPGKIYGVGFVKSYAAFLDLDAEAAGNQFKLEHYAQPQPTETEDVTRKKQQQEKLIANDQDNRVPGMMVIVLAIAFLMACLAGWQYFRAEDTNVQQLLNYIPDAPEQEVDTAMATLPVTPASSADTEAQNDSAGAEEDENTDTAPEPALAVAAPAAEPEMPATNTQTDPVAASRAENTATQQNLNLNQTEELQKRGNDARVILRAHADSWVKITDNTGRSLFQQVMRAGDEYFVPNQSGVSMATGNAGGLDIYVDGNQIEPIGNSGDIMRGVSLQPDSLKARRPQNQRLRR